MDISDYVEEIKAIFKQLSDCPIEMTNHEIITVALGVLAERAKDRRMNEIREKMGAEKPKNDWRSKPATQKQIDVLRRNKVPFGPSITMGEASDKIDELSKGWKK